MHQIIRITCHKQELTSVIDRVEELIKREPPIVVLKRQSSVSKASMQCSCNLHLNEQLQVAVWQLLSQCDVVQAHVARKPEVCHRHNVRARMRQLIKRESNQR